ncbi:hypothetical protein RKLH11_4263 [Rhodobacteraceae bacterium KLH11]|nr:hypothetical protein RKLH11_4263 [Rhodobacteraceae bacterium KLH11]
MPDETVTVLSNSGTCNRNIDAGRRWGVSCEVNVGVFSYGSFVLWEKFSLM